MLEQIFTQVSEISVGITFRCYPFVHLEDMDTLPRHLLAGKIPEHDPGCFATAHRHYELAPGRNRLLSCFSNQLGSFESDRVGIVIDFDLHQAASLLTANAFFSPGLLQPPIGATRSVSAGPQVP